MKRILETILAVTLCLTVCFTGADLVYASTPAQVKNVTAAQIGAETASLSWKAVSGAKKYQIFAATATSKGKAGTYKYVKTVSKTSASLANQKGYKFYKVRSVNKSGGKGKFSAAKPIFFVKACIADVSFPFGGVAGYAIMKVLVRNTSTKNSLYVSSLGTKADFQIQCLNNGKWEMGTIDLGYNYTYDAHWASCIMSNEMGSNNLYLAKIAPGKISPIYIQVTKMSLSEPFASYSYAGKYIQTAVNIYSKESLVKPILKFYISNNMNVSGDNIMADKVWSLACTPDANETTILRIR